MGPLGPWGTLWAQWGTLWDHRGPIWILFGSRPRWAQMLFSDKTKTRKLHISVGFPFVHVHPIFWGPYRERSRRVSMNAFNFSPDDGHCCQFMNQNVPKPMFLGLDSEGALILIFPADTSPVGPQLCVQQGPDGLGWVHPGPWGSGSGSRFGSGTRRTLRAQPGPPPIAPRKKIRRSGDPRCDNRGLA